MKERLIFLVEDNKFEANIVSSTLRKSGHAVHVAASAEQALADLSGGVMPDLFIIDIGLSGMDGIILCQKIKEVSKLKKIPLMFLTGKNDFETEEAGFRAGAVDFIRKPASMLVLDARISLQLNQIAKDNSGSSASRGNNEHDISLRLGEFLSGVLPAAQGNKKDSRLHIINLGPLRDALGARWEKVSGKVVTLSEGVIAANMSKGDAYKYLGYNVFAVIFPTLSGPQGHLRAITVAEKLCRKLLGDEFDRGQYGADFIERMLEFDYLDDEPTTKDKTATPDLAKRRIMSEVFVEYHPIWNPSTNYVSSFRVSFCRKNDEGTFYGRNILHSGTGDRYWPDVYDLMLSEVSEKIATISSSVDRFVITLHIDFLLNRQFTAMLQKHLSNPGLRRKLAIEVVGVDDRINIQLVQACNMLLKNISDQVMVRISPESKNIQTIKTMNVEYIGLNLFDILQCGLGQMGAYTVAVHFAKKCASIGMDCYVWGVNGAQDFQVTRAAKFAMFSGRAFGSPEDKPVGNILLSPETIIRNSV